jgi:hypothetical protein
MAESEQRPTEEEERQYRRVEDWFAGKGKLFWTEEASGGTWDAYVASGPVPGERQQSSQAIAPCVSGAATRLEAAQKARDLYRKLL